MTSKLSELANKATDTGRLIVDRAGWSLAVELLQLASSSLVFLVLVRFMEPAVLGQLGGLLAVAFPSLSIATVGTHFLLLRRSSQGHDLADAWNRALTVGLIGPTLAAVVMIALRPVFLPNVDPTAYVLIFIGNLPFYWINELAVYLGVGSGRMKQAAQVRSILVFFRFLAVVWYAIWGGGTLVGWAAASAVSFMAGAMGALWFVHQVFGLRPRFSRDSLADLPEGIPFSANSMNEGLVDSSDRWLLARFDLNVDAGLYTLGARIIQFGYLPLRALLRSYDSDLFGAGKDGVRAALRITRRMALPGMAIAAAVTAGFLILAPALPLVAGDNYRETIDVIRWLAMLPVIRMAQYLLGNTLSASDRQWWRTGATFVAMVTNLGLNFWLIPNGSWKTAVMTTFVSEVLLAVLLLATVTYWVRRERQEASATASENPGYRPIR